MEHKGNTSTDHVGKDHPGHRIGVFWLVSTGYSKS